MLGNIFATSISGTIKDLKTGEPLPYANIVIENIDIGTASDINGYYIIPSIESGALTTFFCLSFFILIY